METVDDAPSHTFWTATAVITMLSHWFGYSGPDWWSCHNCNIHIIIKPDGSYFHACSGGYGGFAVVGTPWEANDLFEVIK